MLPARHARTRFPRNPPPNPASPILRQFLATCKDPAKIVWTYVELQEHFPLDKWAEGEAEVSSKAPFAAAAVGTETGRGFWPRPSEAIISALILSCFAHRLELLRHLKSLGRRPERGDFLQFRLQPHPAELFSVFMRPQFRPTGWTLAVHVNNFRMNAESERVRGFIQKGLSQKPLQWPGAKTGRGHVRIVF